MIYGLIDRAAKQLHLIACSFIYNSVYTTVRQSEEMIAVFIFLMACNLIIFNTEVIRISVREETSNVCVVAIHIRSRYVNLLSLFMDCGPIQVNQSR